MPIDERQEKGGESESDQTHRSWISDVFRGQPVHSRLQIACERGESR